MIIRLRARDGCRVPFQPSQKLVYKIESTGVRLQAMKTFTLSGSFCSTILLGVTISSDTLKARPLNSKRPIKKGKKTVD
jgi:hypothetical protein